MGWGGWTFTQSQTDFLSAHSGLLKKEYSSAHGLGGGVGGHKGWFDLTFYEFENHVTSVTQDLFL